MANEKKQYWAASDGSIVLFDYNDENDDVEDYIIENWGECEYGQFSSFTDLRNEEEEEWFNQQAFKGTSWNYVLDEAEKHFKCSLNSEMNNKERIIHDCLYKLWIKLKEEEEERDYGQEEEKDDEEEDKHECECGGDFEECPCCGDEYACSHCGLCEKNCVESEKECVKCGSCDEAEATHKVFRDALGVYEHTCDKCFKKEYEEEEEGFTQQTFEALSAAIVSEEEKESARVFLFGKEEDERYCDNDDCPYGGFCCFEVLEEHKGKPYICEGCVTGKGLQEQEEVKRLANMPYYKRVRLGL
tara:strand:+ start:1002 stop:1904 length:903 start_codon:yes stop_codon:yes gene_type:complete